MTMPILIKDNIEPLAIATPIMTRERFASLTGLSQDTVRGMMDRRQIKVIKIGRRILVNLAAMTWKDIPTLLVPVVSIEYLAEQSGLTDRCLVEQYALRNLPGEKMGKRIMIDMVALTMRCMNEQATKQEQEQEQSNSPA